MKRNLKEKMKQLLAVEGIGEICALVMIFQLPELGKVFGKEITSLLGLHPIAKTVAKNEDGVLSLAAELMFVPLSIWLPSVPSVITLLLKLFTNAYLPMGKLRCLLSLLA